MSHYCGCCGRGIPDRPDRRDPLTCRRCEAHLGDPGRTADNIAPWLATFEARTGRPCPYSQPYASPPGLYWRVLVTGSRRWLTAAPIRLTLEVQGARAARNGLTPVLVHGGCPDGADALADAAARRLGWPVPDVLVADWDTCIPGVCRHGARRRRRDGGDYCQAAGMRRNAEMVATRPDVVAAFIRARSPGASQCVRAAKAAGLLVLVAEQP